MKNINTIILAAAAAILLMTVACDKTDPVKPIEPIEGEDTAEEIILAVQNTYLLESFEEKDTYVLTFHNPSPVKLKKDYPDGIKSVTLQKGAVKKVTKAPSDVTIVFSDGKSAKLSFHAWIDASLDSDFVSFDEDGEPRSVAYTINGSAPEAADVEASVKGAESVATYEITPDEGGKGGLITFSLTGSGYFNKEAQVVFSNGEKSVTLPLTLVREEFEFEDGSVAKKFEFKEYARFFDLWLSKEFEGVSISIPEDVDWIHIDGPWTVSKKTHINIDLNKNGGDTERHAVITIRREGAAQELTVEISQIGALMEGSLERSLIALYNATDGDNWTGTIWNTYKERDIPSNENWCSDKPLWEWAGVKPTSTMSDNDGSNVRYNGTDDKWSLEINSEAFYRKAGPYEVPEEFWQNISCYFSLDLNCNNLKGTIPDEFWNINFREIDLYGNPRLEGRLGDGFYNMTDLGSFSISGTKIKGTLSSDIIKLTNLYSFDISYCEFEGTIPEEFGMLHLSNWNFERNYFTELPQFVRYRSGNKPYGWVITKATPSDDSIKQRDKNGNDVYLPFPLWAHIKYGAADWGRYWDDELKKPEFPYADDLQYHATEYYWDGKDWRHPNLEFPAREYYFDGKEWIHDASCPWDQEYIDPRGSVWER